MPFNYNTADNLSDGFRVFDFIKKHWALCFFMVFIIPIVIISIKTAIQTNNFLYPFLQLAEKLLASDSVLYRNVMLFQTDPDKLIGMARPDFGLLLSLKYYLLFFLNIVFDTLANISFIFLPFTVIYKLVKLTDNSKAVKSFVIAFTIFIGYLFVSNSIIMTNEVLNGNITPKISDDRFYNYLIISKYIMPFHGVYALGEYIFRVVFLT